MTKLKIKAICANIGYCEDARATSLIVIWKGKPFRDAQKALTHFFRACAEQTEKAEEARFECCLEQLRVKKDSKACPSCGCRFGTTVQLDIADYFADLFSADVDNFEEKAYPYKAAPDMYGGQHIGGWYFFEGVPENCDMVVVDNFSADIDADDEWPYRVMRVGKAVA